MDNGTLILLGIAIVIILIIWIYYYSKGNYVKKTSKRYEKVLELNGNEDVHYVQKTLKYKKRYSSKSSLDRCDLKNVALFFVEENIDEIKEIFEVYDECEDEYKKYMKKYNAIMQARHNIKNLNKFFFSTTESYKSYEKDVCEKVRIKNYNLITLNITADYVSPKGQNYWMRETSYSNNEIKELLKIVDNRQQYKKTAKYQRDIMSDSLRYDVLKRDNYRCRICGASAIEDGVKLEVDHIVPVSKGGLTVKSNLQTLCERCNRGKSNK